MAFKQQFHGNRLKHIWNVSEAVGKGAPNEPDDVMLVQYMLTKLYEDVHRGGRLRPPGEMTVDGICGPVTQRWILAFQTDLNQDVASMVSMDGRIDRAHGLFTSLPGGVAVPGTALGRMVYTIVVMNRVFGDDFPEYHADPRRAPDMPAELKRALRPQRQHATA